VVVCFENRSFSEAQLSEPLTLLKEVDGFFLASQSSKAVQRRHSRLFGNRGKKTRPPAEKRKIKRWKTKMGDLGSEAAHMN